MTHSKISEDLAWMDHAACLGHDPELWFPSHNANTREKARRICYSCPVIWECRVFSITQSLANIEYGLDGIWGGLTRSERRNGRKARYYLAEAQMKIEEQLYGCNGSH